MNQAQIVKDGVISEDSAELDLIGTLIVLARYKKMIIGVTLGSAVLALACSLVLPKVYQASTKLLPPQQTQSSAAALLSQLGGIAGAAAGAAGLKNPNDLYVGMLKSRTVADRLIAQFNLKKVYDTESQEYARKKLETNTSVISGRDGLITVEVEDTDKKLVAPIANAYVAELFRMMKTLAVTDASQRRLFYEKQLDETKDNLAKAEAALKNKMDRSGVVSVDTESRGILETVAKLRAQTSAKEIQLNSMRAFLTPTNPDYRRVEEELNSLRIQLTKLENGRGNGDESIEKAGGLENIKLLRDLKYQQMLYEALAKQYEVARIDEAKDPSVIQVLDMAVEPERKAKPRLSFLLIGFVSIGLFSSILLAFFLDARRRALLSVDGAARWAELKSHI